MPFHPLILTQPPKQGEAVCAQQRVPPVRLEFAERNQDEATQMHPRVRQVEPEGEGGWNGELPGLARCAGLEAKVVEGQEVQVQGPGEVSASVPPTFRFDLQKMGCQAQRIQPGSKPADRVQERQRGREGRWSRNGLRLVNRGELRLA